ncbi:MAG: cysteine desulfurase [Alphaproteobacteria bacterium]|nr:cysteine desulfurase [Alphaproteobacteria bacterium]
MTTAVKQTKQQRAANPKHHAGQDDSLAKGFDVQQIRSDFPILYRDVYNKPLIYLDNGASAQKPVQVIEAMDHAYRFQYANVHRGMHYLSNAATTAYEEARETTRRFLNAGRADEIIFTSNATEAINLVAQSFGGMVLGEGDEVVLSIMEHHSNIVPWHFHRERCGAVLKWAPIQDDGTFLMDEFERLLTPRTKLVAITHMSNVLGTVVPVKDVIGCAHARGIPVLVDGSQAAVHQPLDVQDLDADFYVFTGHKTYGPSGIGVLYGKREHLEAMPPFLGGGEMIDTVRVDDVTYADPPHRFEAGTPAIVEAVGLNAALNYMMQVGRERIAAHEGDLVRYAHERLATLPSVTIFGTTPDKGAIVSFNVDGMHPHDLATIVDRSGVAVRAGHHCAQPLMERLGVTATCRASFAMYNTRDEVDQFVAALEKAKEFFA